MVCKVKNLWVLCCVVFLFSSNIYAIKEIKTQTISLSDVFEYVTGVKESSGIKLDFKQGDDGLYYIENTKNQNRFCCGNIGYLSLDALRKRDADISACDQTDLKPSFKVICYTRKHPENFSQADVCALQAAPENKDAVFHVSSRLHGLEGGCVYGGENTVSGMGFNRMLRGPAQGEFASFSAAPGTIYKIYGYEPINLLADTELKNLVDSKSPGGAMPNIEQVAKFDSLPGSWIDKLRIYFHEGIEVVVGKELDDKRREVVSKQKINQILTGVFDWRLSEQPFYDGQSAVYLLPKHERQALRRITQQIMAAFYEGMLLSAGLKGKHKIFFAPCGGGVFQNDHDLIVAAIANEINLKIIKKYRLDVVLVVHYGGDQANYWHKSMRKFWKNKDIDFEFKQL
jgi:hypothetical protein